jgi:type 2 lantibiotic biosynthesis protein LanM
VSDIFGNQIHTPAQTGLSRAKARWANLSQEEIEWQSRVIQISTSFVVKTDKAAVGQKKYTFDRKLNLAGNQLLSEDQIIPELKHIIKTVSQYAYIKEQSAGWIGLDWLAGSDVGQLVPLGPDLYNGVGGIALFLAAYAKQFQDENAKELAMKSLASLRQQIYAPTAARWARSLGLGGASGLGSVLYTLTHASVLLDDPALLEDAMQVSRLFTDELIDADQTLDVIAGSAGGILSLLALYRHTQSKEVLAKAIRCGEHLLKTPRVGEEGRRSWIGLGMGESILNGISHGASGFELALRSLSIASGRQDFMEAAKECYAFEVSNYDSEEHNWPDLREDEDGKPMRAWVCQWCHGAPGIGLSRIGSVKFGADLNPVEEDIKNAAVCVKNNWPNRVDTLCCGTLGAIEFLNEAGQLLSDQNIASLANQRLAEIFSVRQETGDYSWTVGGTEFNLGLFRGISGVGYTLLRRLNPNLPNVLIWE